MEVVNLCHQKETESASEYITAREVNKLDDGATVLEWRIRTLCVLG
jgi:hypothetical protein